MTGNPEAGNWSLGLQGLALKIASSDDRRCRVLAGPGTGKSFALKRLVTRLLERGDDPKRILVVTFTRTAGADLQSEMENLGIPGCEDIVSGTLHSLCFQILGRAAALNTHNRVPRSLIQVKKHGGWLGFELDPLLEDLGLNPALGDKRNRIKLMRAYEAAFARQQDETAGDALQGVDQIFARDIQQWLVFHQAILIGELVPETLRYLEDNPVASEHRMFDHVIVDEYQDLNKAEQTIIDLLAQSSSLMVVGDKDQSIYSFRHANPEGIDDFSNRHQGTIDLALVQCRRCDHQIVTAANQLISNNHIDEAPPFSGMVLDPTRGPGLIRVIQWSELEAETQGIADYVNHLVLTGAFTPGQILIMTPRRIIGYQIRNALLRHGVFCAQFLPRRSN